MPCKSVAKLRLILKTSKSCAEYLLTYSQKMTCYRRGDSYCCRDATCRVRPSATRRRFLATGERLFAYRRKVFRLQAKGLSLTGKNLSGACFVPPRSLFCTVTGPVSYRHYDMIVVSTIPSTRETLTQIGRNINHKLGEI